MTAAGMDDVISKPFRIDEIVERMRKWMVLGKRNNAA
jgi:DNA-binding response OmpR family regulator